MKKNKIKKIVTRLIVGIVLTALVIVNIQVGLTDGNNSNISLDEITMSVFTPAVAATGGGDGECKTEIVTCSLIPLEQVTWCVSVGDGIDCNCGDSEECP